MRKGLITLALVALSAPMAQVASATVVINGGFESGSGGIPTNWTVNADPNAAANGAINGQVTSPVYDGTYSEEVQALNSSAPSVPGEDSNVYQNTSTVGGDTVTTGGGPYTLSFYLEGTAGVSGVLFVQAQNANNTGPQGGGGAFTYTSLPSTWTLETISLGTPGAGITGYQTEFSAETGAVSSGSETAFIDDVSITGSAPVPEPASLSLISLGSLALLHRRRSRNA